MFSPLMPHHKSIQVHFENELCNFLTCLQKKPRCRSLNESFACVQCCLHSPSPCVKAPHSIPTELHSARVQLFISLCQEFSLASTCQYPPQIGRQAHIWHMVQSRAASPSLFSWPAQQHTLVCACAREQSQIDIQIPMMHQCLSAL